MSKSTKEFDKSAVKAVFENTTTPPEKSSVEVTVSKKEKKEKKVVKTRKIGKIKNIVVSIKADELEKIGTKAAKSAKKKAIESIGDKLLEKKVTEKSLRTAINAYFMEVLPAIIVKQIAASLNVEKFVIDTLVQFKMAQVRAKKQKQAATKQLPATTPAIPISPKKEKKHKK